MFMNTKVSKPLADSQTVLQSCRIQGSTFPGHLPSGLLQGLYLDGNASIGELNKLVHMRVADSCGLSALRYSHIPAVADSRLTPETMSENLL